MKIGSIMWNIYLNMFTKAIEQLDSIECIYSSSREVEENPSKIENLLNEFKSCDFILLYRSTENFWNEIETKIKEIGKDVPIVCLSHDPSLWSLSTVKLEVLTETYMYLTYGGYKNFLNMLKYLCNKLCRMKIKVTPPEEMLWEGCYHPATLTPFSNVDEYLKWYHVKEDTPFVGILFSRHAWVSGELNIENMIIKELEKNEINVLPVFTTSSSRENYGSRGNLKTAIDFFTDKNGKSRIDALIKLHPFLLTDTSITKMDKEVGEDGVDFFKKMDVPVFSPITTTYETISEWRESTHGFSGQLTGWAVAMPEFEGVIEPIIVGAGEDIEKVNGKIRLKVPIEERITKLVLRVKKWIELRRKKISERKVVFILHNNPCASVEATVGGGAKLDTLESVSRIMKIMKEKGYTISSPPQDGKDLINTIMSRKAISEFRWTTVSEIVSKGGALALIDLKEYNEWFNKLPKRVRERMIKAWGNPPGEEINGVPSAMVYNNKIVVTGVKYGNVIVSVQPKRGCAGPRCDGKVCRILHEPDIVPPHQYFATYRYLQEIFGADVIVHVGTHGNMEFLPGKSIGLSSECFPDIIIGETPHLYIYNSDNPPEGIIAKRRGLAVLVDHMQTVIKSGGLYDELEELDRLVEEYNKIDEKDKTRLHILQHQIIETIKKAKIENEIIITLNNKDNNIKKIRLSQLEENEIHNVNMRELISATHDALGVIRNTYIQDGMHIFGDVPKGDDRVNFIYSIMRYDANSTCSIRRTVAQMIGIEYDSLLNKSNKIINSGFLIEKIDNICKLIIKELLKNEEGYVEIIKKILGDYKFNEEFFNKFDEIVKRVRNIDKRINETKEIESLLHGFEGGYIPAGPSGLIMRGREDILPTGRNFYSLDPKKVPTRSAWEVGKRLAEAVIKKHKEETGLPPENVAIYWMANDIMWADGEGMAQIMYLIGVEPVWESNGRLSGFAVIPLERLGRERIDVTIRVSGIARDNFFNCIEFIDEAIQTVATLPEPIEKNFIKKHVLSYLQKIDSDIITKDELRDATLRIFASRPGTYSAGTQLAVYASAWKEEKDLADIFIFWNGCAYGKGSYGEEKYKNLAENLKTVDITYNKVVSDESDLLGCCSYFGVHGGMTAAARSLSGKKVKTYYGDTREPQFVEVRDMADEIRRIVRTKLLNPVWIEGQKRHGYKGASDISKRIGRVFGWEVTTGEVDDWIFDDITKTFVLDEKNRNFFKENNPWALEEISRRLIECYERGLWKANKDIIDRLKESYLETESWLEEDMEEIKGDFQGGNIDVFSPQEIEYMKSKMEEIHRKIDFSKKG